MDSSSLAQSNYKIETQSAAKNLDWKEDAANGRKLFGSPMFTDGSLLYVVSQRFEPEWNEQNEREAEQDAERYEQKYQEHLLRKESPDGLAIEVFDPDENMKFLREVKLMKHDMSGPVTDD